VLILFDPGKKKGFENSKTFFWVAAFSAGRSLEEGQQTIFNFRPRVDPA